jgi:hypothetical protein
MKRVALILAVVGILCLGIGQIQANDFHHGHHGYYGGYRHGPVVVARPIWIAPAAVVPYAVYPPVYRPWYYYPGTASGFYYQGRGVSIGIGF